MVKKGYLFLIFVFLYAPIIILMIFSFNDGDSTARMTGFSFRWYQDLFTNNSIKTAFRYTILCAIISTIVSTIFGTITSFGIYKSTKRMKKYILNFNYLPVINPDIITGVAIMLLYITISIPRGFTSMVLAHIMFSTPYVVLTVLPRLYAMNPNMAEAAMDLGATPWQSVRKIMIPEILPGIIAGGLIAFTMSIDDFVISYFTTGSGVTNLSIEIFSRASRRIRPNINALATLMVITVMLTVLISNRLTLKKKYKEVVQ